MGVDGSGVGVLGGAYVAGVLVAGANTALGVIVAVSRVETASVACNETDIGVMLGKLSGTVLQACNRSAKVTKTGKILLTSGVYHNKNAERHYIKLT